MRFLLLCALATCGTRAPDRAPSAAAAIPARDGRIAAPADDKIDCRTPEGREPFGEYEQARIYCSHVADGCCGDPVGQAWVCNNAHYVDWLAVHYAR